MINNIGRTPAFKALLLRKDDVGNLPLDFQKNLKPGKTMPFYILTPHSKIDKTFVSVIDGKKKSLNGQVLGSYLVLRASSLNCSKQRAEKNLHHEFISDSEVNMEFVEDKDLQNVKSNKKIEVIKLC